LVHIKDHIVVLHERGPQDHYVLYLRLDCDSTKSPVRSELLRVASIHHIERRWHFYPGIAEHQEKAWIPSEVTRGEHCEVDLDASFVVQDVVHHCLVHCSRQH
jgi:hypothetical protein